MNKGIKFLLGFSLGLIMSVLGVYAVSLPAESVEYSNESSNLSSTNIQGALDELYAKASTCENS